MNNHDKLETFNSVRGHNLNEQEQVKNSTCLESNPNVSMLPVLPSRIRQFVLPGGAVAYMPTLLGVAQIGYRDTKSGLNASEQISLFVPMSNDVFIVDWLQAQELNIELEQLDLQLPAGATTLSLPEQARLSKSYTVWKRELTDWLYRNKPLTLHENKSLKLLSEPDESLSDFQIRVQQAARETKEVKLEALRKKYAVRIKTLEEKIRKAEQAVAREKEQARTQGMQTVISLGSTLLSAFIGKKALSATTVGKATTTARGASRALKERCDINRSQETVEAYCAQLAELEEQLSRETDELALAMDEAATDITERQLNPLKKDIMIRSLVILWVPES